MTNYSIHFHCEECCETHPLGVYINLDEGPAKTENLNRAYAGKEPDPFIVSLTNNITTCPITGRLTKQKDNEQVYLVPIGR